MGDRHDRDRAQRLKRFGGTMPPEPILTWGIGDVALSAERLGHNGGPSLDEEPGYRWRRYCWSKAHKEAWKPPSMAVLKFRVARAEAAGISYEQYVAELLDSGRHLQKADVDKRRRAPAKPAPLGGHGGAPTPVVLATRGQPPAGTPSTARPVPKPLGGNTRT